MRSGSGPSGRFCPCQGGDGFLSNLSGAKEIRRKDKNLVLPLALPHILRYTRRETEFQEAYHNV